MSWQATCSDRPRQGPKGSTNRAFACQQSVEDKRGWAQILASKDMFVEAVDLTGGNAECDAGVAFFVAFISAIQNRQVQGGTVILGDLSVQGNHKAMNSIQEPLQLALDNGAIRALLP